VLERSIILLRLRIPNATHKATSDVQRADLGFLCVGNPAKESSDQSIRTYAMPVKETRKQMKSVVAPVAYCQQGWRETDLPACVVRGQFCLVQQ
jgi:hypothetical protein